MLDPIASYSLRRSDGEAIDADFPSGRTIWVALEAWSDAGPEVLVARCTLEVSALSVRLTSPDVLPTWVLNQRFDRLELVIEVAGRPADAATAVSILGVDDPGVTMTAVNLHAAPDRPEWTALSAFDGENNKYISTWGDLYIFSTQRGQTAESCAALCLGFSGYLDRSQDSLPPTCVAFIFQPKNPSSCNSDTCNTFDDDCQLVSTDSFDTHSGVQFHGTYSHWKTARAREYYRLKASLWTGSAPPRVFSELKFRYNDDFGDPDDVPAVMTVDFVGNATVPGRHNLTISVTADAATSVVDGELSIPVAECDPVLTCSGNGACADLSQPPDPLDGAFICECSNEGGTAWVSVWDRLPLQCSETENKVKPKVECSPNVALTSVIDSEIITNPAELFCQLYLTPEEGDDAAEELVETDRSLCVTDGCSDRQSGAGVYDVCSDWRQDNLVEEQRLECQDYIELHPENGTVKIQEERCQNVTVVVDRFDELFRCTCIATASSTTEVPFFAATVASPLGATAFQAEVKYLHSGNKNSLRTKYGSGLYSSAQDFHATITRSDGKAESDAIASGVTAVFTYTASNFGHTSSCQTTVTVLRIETVQATELDAAIGFSFQRDIDTAVNGLMDGTYLTWDADVTPQPPPGINVMFKTSAFAGGHSSATMFFDGVPTEYGVYKLDVTVTVSKSNQPTLVTKMNAGSFPINVVECESTLTCNNRGYCVDTSLPFDKTDDLFTCRCNANYKSSAPTVDNPFDAVTRRRNTTVVGRWNIGDKVPLCDEYDPTKRPAVVCPSDISIPYLAGEEASLVNPLSLHNFSARIRGSIDVEGTSYRKPFDLSLNGDPNEFLEYNTEYQDGFSTSPEAVRQEYGIFQELKRSSGSQGAAEPFDSGIALGTRATFQYTVTNEIDDASESCTTQVAALLALTKPGDEVEVMIWDYFTEFDVVLKAYGIIPGRASRWTFSWVNEPCAGDNNGPATLDSRLGPPPNVVCELDPSDAAGNGRLHCAGTPGTPGCFPMHIAYEEFDSTTGAILSNATVNGGPLNLRVVECDDQYTCTSGRGTCTDGDPYDGVYECLCKPGFVDFEQEGYPNSKCNWVTPSMACPLPRVVDGPTWPLAEEDFLAKVPTKGGVPSVLEVELLRNDGREFSQDIAPGDVVTVVVSPKSFDPFDDSIEQDADLDLGAFVGSTEALTAVCEVEVGFLVANSTARIPMRASHFAVHQSELWELGATPILEISAHGFVGELSWRHVGTALPTGLSWDVALQPQAICNELYDGNSLWCAEDSLPFVASSTSGTLTLRLLGTTNTTGQYDLTIQVRDVPDSTCADYADQELAGKACPSTLADRTLIVDVNLAPYRLTILECAREPTCSGHGECEYWDGFGAPSRAPPSAVDAEGDLDARYFDGDYVCICDETHWTVQVTPGNSCPPSWTTCVQGWEECSEEIVDVRPVLQCPPDRSISASLLTDTVPTPFVRSDFVAESDYSARLADILGLDVVSVHSESVVRSDGLDPFHDPLTPGSVVTYTFTATNFDLEQTCTSRVSTLVAVAPDLYESVIHFPYLHPDVPITVNGTMQYPGSSAVNALIWKVSGNLSEGLRPEVKEPAVASWAADSLEGTSIGISGTPSAAGIFFMRLTVTEALPAPSSIGEPAIVNGEPFRLSIIECEASTTCSGGGRCNDTSIPPNPYDLVFECVCDAHHSGTACEIGLPVCRSYKARAVELEELKAAIARGEEIDITEHTECVDCAPGALPEGSGLNATRDEGKDSTAICVLPEGVCPEDCECVWPNGGLRAGFGRLTDDELTVTCSTARAFNQGGQLPAVTRVLDLSSVTPDSINWAKMPGTLSAWQTQELKVWGITQEQRDAVDSGNRPDTLLIILPAFSQGGRRSTETAANCSYPVDWQVIWDSPDNNLQLSVPTSGGGSAQCAKGSYADTSGGGCTPCSRGQFYQDLLGAAGASDYCGCKSCASGTFTDRAGADTASDCQKCPPGTDSAVVAGYRACSCLDGYYRVDRFQQCFACDEAGTECKDDGRSLLSGYWWKLGDVVDPNDYVAWYDDLTVSD